MIIDRRAFVAGAAVAAFSPALPLLASDVAVPELRAVQPPVFMISGWSSEGGWQHWRRDMDEGRSRMADRMAVANDTQRDRCGARQIGMQRCA